LAWLVGGTPGTRWIDTNTFMMIHGAKRFTSRWQDRHHTQISTEKCYHTWFGIDFAPKNMNQHAGKTSSAISSSVVLQVFLSNRTASVWNASHQRFWWRHIDKIDIRLRHDWEVYSAILYELSHFGFQISRSNVYRDFFRDLLCSYSSILGIHVGLRAAPLQIRTSTRLHVPSEFVKFRHFQRSHKNKTVHIVYKS